MQEEQSEENLEGNTEGVSDPGKVNSCQMVKQHSPL